MKRTRWASTRLSQPSSTHRPSVASRVSAVGASGAALCCCVSKGVASDIEGPLLAALREWRGVGGVKEQAVQCGAVTAQPEIQRLDQRL